MDSVIEVPCFLESLHLIKINWNHICRVGNWGTSLLTSVLNAFSPKALKKKKKKKKEEEERKACNMAGGWIFLIAQGKTTTVHFEFVINSFLLRDLEIWTQSTRRRIIILLYPRILRVELFWFRSFRFVHDDHEESTTQIIHTLWAPSALQVVPWRMGVTRGYISSVIKFVKRMFVKASASECGCRRFTHVFGSVTGRGLLH